MQNHCDLCYKTNDEHCKRWKRGFDKQPAGMFMDRQGNFCSMCAKTVKIHGMNSYGLWSSIHQFWGASFPTDIESHPYGLMAINPWQGIQSHLFDHGTNVALYKNWGPQTGESPLLKIQMANSYCIWVHPLDKLQCASPVICLLLHKSQ